jgi:hypothetical protein
MRQQLDQYTFTISTQRTHHALKGQTPSAVGTALGNAHTTKLAMAGQEHNIDFGSFLII